MRLFLLTALVIGLPAYFFWYRGGSEETKKRTLKYALVLVFAIFLVIIGLFFYSLFKGIG